MSAVRRWTPWSAALAVVLASAAPVGAAPARGEVVLRGTSGGVTATFPRGVRLVVPDGFTPKRSGNLRGFVIREASGALVLSAATVAVPGVGHVPVFARGQGYEQGRLTAGRYRISLLGDARGADIVLPVEGLAGRRVLDLRNGLQQSTVALGEPTGRAGGWTYRAGPIGVRPGMGLLYAWVADRGAGVHDVDFCMVPVGATCPDGNPPEVLTSQRRFAGVHLSAPSTRPPGAYDIVMRATSVGEVGGIGMVAWTFL